MSVMSKTSPRSLFESCICVVSTALVLKQNSEFGMQVTSGTLSNLNGVVTSIPNDGRMSPYPHQKKGQVLALKDAFISDESQGFNYRIGLEYSYSIDLYVVLVIAFISNYLRKVQDETIRIMAFIQLKSFLAVLNSLKPFISGSLIVLKSLEKKFAMYVAHICNSPGLPTILGLFCRSISINKIILEKDLKHFHSLPEILRILETCSQMPLKTLRIGDSEISISVTKPANSDQLCLKLALETKLDAKDPEEFRRSLETMTSEKTDSRSLETFDETGRKKLLGICYSCEEMVSKKMFFDERRFGLLKNCDCMICYGCLRKEARTSGVVKGPVACPSCSVESYIVAASARWIEGDEKVKFFDLLPRIPETLDCAGVEQTSRCRNRSSFRAPEVVKPRLASFELDTVASIIRRTTEKGKPQSFGLLHGHKAPRMKSGWTGFPTRKDNIYARPPRMGLVN